MDAFLNRVHVFEINFYFFRRFHKAKQTITCIVHVLMHTQQTSLLPEGFIVKILCWKLLYFVDQPRGLVVRAPDY